MKMENVIKAAADGVVDKVAVAVGDVIEDGREVILLKRE
jgi:biotin carboxyl carrier protein